LKWTRFYIECNAQAQDAISELMMENGAGGLQIDDEPSQGTVTLSTYFEGQVKLESLKQKMKEAINQLPKYGLDAGHYKIASEVLDDGQWSNEWKKYYHARRISRYLAIAPSWEDDSNWDKKTAVIRLDPGKSFGTGTHPTTILALHALEATISGQEDMIDVGTGSGVLSIAAKYLGVKHIDAFDVDDESMKAARENFALNPVATNIHLAKNSLLDGVETQTDLIVANILAEIIVPLIPQAATHLKANGKLILSGIIEDKLLLIEKTLEENGFVIDETLKMKDWYGIVATMPRE